MDKIRINHLELLGIHIIIFYISLKLLGYIYNQIMEISVYRLKN